MKTFEEHLQNAVGATYPLQDILANLSAEEILEEVNIFSKEVVRQTLKNAAGNATFNVTGILTNNQYKEKSLLYEKGVGNRVVERTVTINKQSILSDKNIPEL